MFNLHWVPNFTKIGAHCNFETESPQVHNFGLRLAISNIIFMINELELLWVPNFTVLGIYFIFGTKFSWNEGIHTCFNFECVLLGRNFDFLVVTARYLVVTARYCSLLGGYCSLPLVPTFSMNGSHLNTYKVQHWL